ncbi:hypothetical protein LX36DRAFT_87344 [Colletotrichum falcatum]|nr:hypothetical protein LX36DRAFT_87344 [Colletotrichum falcatum]
MQAALKRSGSDAIAGLLNMIMILGDGGVCHAAGSFKFSYPACFPFSSVLLENWLRYRVAHLSPRMCSFDSRAHNLIWRCCQARDENVEHSQTIVIRHHSHIDVCQLITP